MNRAQVFAAVGIAAFGLGVAALVAPGLFALGVERAVVVVVALLALGQAVRTALARRRVPVRRAETGEPELRSAVDPPGDDLAASLAQFDRSSFGYGVGTIQRGKLRAVATAALVRYENCSEAAAEDRIERGTWTDDPHAAAFLGGEDAPSVPARLRFRARLAGESPYRRGIRRTVEAIGVVAGIEPGSADEERDDSIGRIARVRRRFGASSNYGTGSNYGTNPGRAGRPDGTPEGSSLTKRATGQWHGVSAAALAGLGVGALTESPAVLLLGVVGIGYAAYARSTRYPDLDLSVERTASPARPTREETVEVTTTVTNDGERVLPDLRLVDGVPSELAVVEGSPRAGTTLRSGESVTITYTVDARRGVHEFGPMHAVARNRPGTVESERRVPAARTTTITCIPPLQPVGTAVPLRERPTRLTGSVDTSVGGEGTEFFATREYQHGDPMNRVDWNRHAKTGELATLQFRETRAATVVLVVDASASAAVGPEPRGPDAVDRSIDAAGRVFTTVQDAGNRVGITALAAEDCWLPPGTGDVHRARARELLATDPVFAAGNRAQVTLPNRWQSRLRNRLPGDAQVVLFSPLCSEMAARTAHRIDAYGYPVTVVSPDPTTGGTSANRLEAVARRFRVSDLRTAGVPVVDWAWDDPLAMALARATRRWSA